MFFRLPQIDLSSAGYDFLTLRVSCCQSCPRLWALYQCSCDKPRRLVCTVPVISHHQFYMFTITCHIKIRLFWENTAAYLENLCHTCLVQNLYSHTGHETTICCPDNAHPGINIVFLHEQACSTKSTMIQQYTNAK